MRLVIKKLIIIELSLDNKNEEKDDDVSTVQLN